MNAQAGHGPAESRPAAYGASALATAATREWFGERILELLPDLTSTALRFTRNPADAEDLVADTVTKAWKHLQDLEDRNRFRGWIFRILTNAWISHCRVRSSRPVHEPLPEEDDCFSLFERLHQPFLLWWSNPERVFLNNLLREDLERAVDALPEDFRAVVVLADVQGFSYQEIAEMLHIPIGTVRSRLSRGRSRLQRSLWEHARDRGWEAWSENPQSGRPS